MENLQGGTLALQHSYHIHRRIGPRGFVTVYEATQEPFARPVLVTVYDRAFEAGAEPELFAKIKSRAERASALDATGILRTVDYGEIDHGIPFVIGEFIDTAISLQTILDDAQTLAPEQVVELIEALATILTSAHRQNLAHGALAPQWIFFKGSTHLAEPHVANFNLGLTAAETLEIPNAILTAYTLSALPPEDFDSKRPTGTEPSPFAPAADVYALGALAYQALVGVHPFFDDPNDTSEGLLHIKTREAPDLTELGIEAELSAAIARALARDPQKRFATPDELARAMRKAITAEPVPKAPRPAKGPLETSSKDEATETITPPSSRETVSSTSQPPPPGPAPGGYALMAVLTILLLSNLAWFFAYLAMEPEPSQDLEERSLVISTHTLPGGLQIKSEPAGAELFIVQGEQSKRLGLTPHVVADALNDQPDAAIVLKKQGYLDQRIALEHKPSGSDLVIYLAPLP